MLPVRLSDEVVDLAPPVPEDIDTITRICQDPDIQGWTTVPSPYARSDAEAFVAEWVPRGWAEGVSRTWAIRSDGALVGMVGLDGVRLGSAEIGYWMAPGARRQGLLHRALQLVLDHALDADDGPRLERVEWHCFAGNWASWRAVWRVGFRFEGVIRGGGVQRGGRRDEWVGSILRGDPREPTSPWPATTIVAPVPDTARGSTP